MIAAEHGTWSGEPILPLLHDFAFVPISSTLAIEALSNVQVRPIENFTAPRDPLSDAFRLATLRKHLSPKILPRLPENSDPARQVKGRCAGWKYSYDTVYASETKDSLVCGACASRALHQDVHEQGIPPAITPSNYLLDLRDGSWYGAGATLESPGIPSQPKHYFYSVLATHRMSVSPIRGVEQCHML